MTKDELYTLCKERGNVYCIEKYFSKHFLEFYIELKTFNFPQSFKFSQKLYHFFNNDPELKLGLCPVCGKRCRFTSFGSSKSRSARLSFALAGSEAIY